MVCLLVVLLVENSRIPFDDPNTHLELTMIHEVMVLDHSGPPLALILYGAALKLMVLGALVVRLLLPVTTGYRGWRCRWCSWAGCWLLAVLIGVIESIMARLRLVRVPQVLIGTTLLSGLRPGPGAALMKRPDGDERSMADLSNLLSAAGHPASTSSPSAVRGWAPASVPSPCRGRSWPCCR